MQEAEFISTIRTFKQNNLFVYQTFSVEIAFPGGILPTDTCDLLVSESRHVASIILLSTYTVIQTTNTESFEVKRKVYKALSSL